MYHFFFGGGGNEVPYLTSYMSWPSNKFSILQNNYDTMKFESKYFIQEIPLKMLSAKCHPFFSRPRCVKPFGAET